MQGGSIQLNKSQTTSGATHTLPWSYEMKRVVSYHHTYCYEVKVSDVDWQVPLGTVPFLQKDKVYRTIALTEMFI